MYVHGFKDKSFNSTIGSGEPEGWYIMNKVHNYLNLKQDFTKFPTDKLEPAMKELMQELNELLNEKKNSANEISSSHKKLLFKEYHVKTINEVHEIRTIGDQKWIPELDYWILALKSLKRQDGNFYYYYLDNSIYNQVHSVLKKSNTFLGKSGDVAELLISNGLAVMNSDRLECTQKYDKVFS